VKKYFSTYPILLLTVTLSVFAQVTYADGQIPFESPHVGCPMAHADPAMSDDCFLPIPKNNVGIVWHGQRLVSERAGSLGLGFSGNGHIVACTYQGRQDNLVIYDFDGNILWSSGRLLDTFSFLSAPLVDIHDRVIACDDTKIVMIDPFDCDADGVILEWQTPLLGKGLVISPVITNEGTLVLATKNGPLYVYDSSDGRCLASKYLQTHDKNDPVVVKLFTRLNGFYETINTPCVKGNRVYVLAQFTIGGLVSLFKRYGSLIAIDICPDAPSEAERIMIAWHYDFGGPSGGSPLLVNDTIYFDGERSKPFSGKDPQAYALIDKGDSYEIKWVTQIPNVVYGSYAKDPRGGFWIIDNSEAKLYRTSEDTGKIFEQVNLDALINETGTHRPCSVITICENESHPMLIIAAKALFGNFFSSYVCAIDLTKNNSLLWKVKVTEGTLVHLDFPFGQFPVVVKDNCSRIFFSTTHGGPWAIGEMG
jgi:hypothetical protein